MTTPIHVFDGNGLQCPHVLLKLQRVVRTAAHHTVFSIFLDNPTASRDVQAWCRVHGHEILEIVQRDGAFQLMIRISKS